MHLVTQKLSKILVRHRTDIENLLGILLKSSQWGFLLGKCFSDITDILSALI